MMKILILSLLFLINKTPLSEEKSDVYIVKDTVHGDLAIMGKDVNIKGVVEGDLAIVGGNLEISGTCLGDVAVVGGNVELLKGSYILGDIAVVGGEIKREKGARVKGEITQFNLGPFNKALHSLKFFGEKVEKKEYKEEKAELDTLKKEMEEEKYEEKIEEEETGVRKIRYIFEDFREFLLYPFLISSILFLVLLFVSLVFPGTTQNMKEVLMSNPWQTFGIGILVQILYFPLIIILIVSIFGIPVVLFLVISTPLLLLYGLTPVYDFIGEKISERINIKKKDKIINILIAIIFFFIFYFIYKITDLYIENSFIEFLTFSIIFIYIYVPLTFSAGLLFTSKLGIKKEK